MGNKISHEFVSKRGLRGKLPAPKDVNEVTSLTSKLNYLLELTTTLNTNLSATRGCLSGSGEEGNQADHVPTVLSTVDVLINRVQYAVAQSTHINAELGVGSTKTLN